MKLHFFDGIGYERPHRMRQRLREEDERNYGYMDRRIEELEAEYQRLIEKYAQMIRKRRSTRGVFKSLNLYFERREVARRIDEVRDLIVTLCKDRLARPYG